MTVTGYTLHETDCRK